MVIAIDGPAGSGKSTIAKMIADKLGFTFMNTGSFYRALALAAIRQKDESEKNGNFETDLSDEKFLINLAKSINLDYKDNSIFLNGENVEPYLRTDKVEAVVAPISAVVPVRKIINKKIQDITKKLDIVCEGRDMTTVVFPDADLKIYLDASVRTRAVRRFNQGTSSLSLAEIEKSIQERDFIDKNKEEGSLKIAEDAFYFDTSDLTIIQVYDKIMRKLYYKGFNMAELEIVKDAKDLNESIQAQLQEEYNNFETPEVGTIKEGIVVAINNGSVFVDVGGKSEGFVPLDEFEETPKIGDSVNVYIERTESSSGGLVVSKLRADKMEIQQKLAEVYKNGEAVSGTISEVVNHGYKVKLGAGITAFLPLSQADVARVEKPEDLLGEKAMFYIEKLAYNRKNNEHNIVVNRRKYLEDKTEAARAEFFRTAQIGDTIEGVAKSFTGFGVFIDLGGFDGLLHINDISWGHVARAKDFLKKGEKVKLKLIRLDPENKRINLSLKHFTADPWLEFENKFNVNDIVTGVVTKTTDFGAFIELSEGIEGLAHISEFSWVKKINKPEDVVKPGDRVQCMVLGYDIQAGRVSLGLKQVTENPWDTIEEKYPAGTRLTGKIVKITAAGAFVQIEEGIDGFLHADDISWTKRIKNIANELEDGQEIEVIVLESNSETRRIRLGVKQLTDDPWKIFSDSYKYGSQIEGEITSIMDFGIFVKVPGDIEGLIHKQNLVENREDNPDEVISKYKVGDKIKAIVLEVNPRTKKAAFSIRDLKRKEQQAEISKYMSDEQEDDGPYTLGDLLKNKNSD